MAYWRMTTMGVVLATALTTACAGDRENPLGDEETGDPSDAASTSTGGLDTASGSVPQPTTEPATDEGPGDGPSTTWDGAGTSGGAEDDGFGMDDDMPLVASVPPIKQGNVPFDQYVLIEGAIVTTPIGRGSDGVEELVVQDPEGGEYSGILVRGVLPDEQVQPGTIVDVLGYVRPGFGYVYLVGEISIVGMQGDPPGLDLELATVAGPLSPALFAHEGVLVRVQDLDVVAAYDGTPRLDGVAHIDGRFAEGLPKVMAGTTLLSVVGVLLLTPSGIAIAPRSADDIVP